MPNCTLPLRRTHDFLRVRANAQAAPVQDRYQRFDRLRMTSPT
ncbi:hypothetical protein OG857_16580 [Streptomyces cyaneofuscatus]|nr:hypothetical protein [Streptomyces cyaneofuscatus]WSD47317.1 hypothetical protein OG857_16580 [Streptomyces cyaneofuscatus]